MATANIVHVLLAAEKEGEAVLNKFLKIVHRKASKGDREYMAALRVWEESKRLVLEEV